MDYQVVFAIPVYKQYQDAVNAVLVAEGRQELISS